MCDMSRNHAPPSDTDPLTTAKATARSLHAAQPCGETPVDITVGPDSATMFRVADLGGWDYGSPELFGVAVEADKQAEDWTVWAR